MRKTPIIIISSATIVLLAISASALWLLNWSWRRPLAPSGGEYFFHRLVLDVPQFLQADPRWGNDPLGPSNDSLGSAGCAVASTAMVLDYYGIKTDPQQLNWYLTANDGYTPQGWIYWERAAWLAPKRVAFAYENLPSYALIDRNLANGNPVIVRLRFPNGVTHFVVICGKDGFDYLIRDPSRFGAEKGVYPLKDFGSKIEALRFYKKL